MSTRATLSVFDDHDKFDIYRHHDGYPHGPNGVIQDVKRAMGKAWPMPGFQAADFSAAMVATMKNCPGSLYLTRQAELHMDRWYHYDITRAEKELHLVVHEYSERVGKVLPIFEGTIDEAIDRFDALSLEIDTELGDPWTALSMAEMALADLEASKRKGYLKKAKEMVFAAMDAKREGNKI
jgi:hypothetical protein